MNRTILASAAVLMAVTLSACAPRVQPEPEPTMPAVMSQAPEVTPEDELTVVPEPEPMSDEEAAQLAASMMDPLFADDAVFAAALDAASAYCDIARSTDAETALALTVANAADFGITPEQAGIIVGIGNALYCPEFGR